MKQLRSRKAFTIVEMVIVIAVIAILATVLVPTISGVIQMANHSADTQFAASLNVQLALWQVENRPIANEYDLKEAINHYYGDLADDGNYFASMTAKSAKQGYQFWYAYNKGVVVVATADNVMEELEKQGITATDLVSVAAPVVEEPVVHFLSNRHAPTQTNSIVMLGNKDVDGFSPKSLRSDLIPGLYLLGNSDVEGDLLDIITKFENLGADEEGRHNEGQDYEDLVNKLKEFEENTIENTLLQKVKKTTIITESTFGYIMAIPSYRKRLLRAQILL